MFINSIDGVGAEEEFPGVAEYNGWMEADVLFFPICNIGGRGVFGGDHWQLLICMKAHGVCYVVDSSGWKPMDNS
jgi:hypothetical protein